MRKNLLDEPVEVALAEVNDDSDSFQGMLEDSDLGPIHERSAIRTARNAATVPSPLPNQPTRRTPRHIREQPKTPKSPLRVLALGRTPVSASPS